MEPDIRDPVPLKGKRCSRPPVRFHVNWWEGTLILGRVHSKQKKKKQPSDCEPSSPTKKHGKLTIGGFWKTTFLDPLSTSMIVGKRVPHTFEFDSGTCFFVQTCLFTWVPQLGALLPFLIWDVLKKGTLIPTSLLEDLVTLTFWLAAWHQNGPETQNAEAKEARHPGFDCANEFTRFSVGPQHPKGPPVSCDADPFIMLYV